MRFSKFYFLIILLNCYNLNYCQITKVIYKFSKTSLGIDSTSIKTKIANSGISQSQTKLIREFLNLNDKFEFELLFNENESLYQKVVKLSSDNKENDIIGMSDKLYNNKYYKNVKDTTKQIITNDYGNYKIKLPYNDLVWKVTSETKIINGYKCFKAETVKTDFYNPVKHSRTVFYPVVWFCSEIPAKFGPIGLDGLPGLVLEASLNGKKYLIATSIIFNYNYKIDLNKYSKYSLLTTSEFEKILGQNLGF